MSSIPNTAVSVVLDPDDWKLQLPVDRDGGFSGRSVEVTDLVNTTSPYFATGGDGALVLAAPVEGATTSGSQYARSELRQLIDGDNAAWTLSQGGLMTETLQVDRLPTLAGGGQARVVIGQVLSDTFDGLVRLYYENGTLQWANGRNEVVAHDTYHALTDGSGHSPDIGLDETFTYSIGVRDGAIVVTAQADGTTYTSTLGIGAGWSDNTFFFKAGIYLGTNESNSSGWGQVSVFGLAVGSGGANPPPPPPPPPAPSGLSDNGLIAALTGTSGDDLFLVSHTETTVRGGRGGRGFDTVQASASWTMGKDVEALVLTGTADIHGTGGRGDDSILGNEGSNGLTGNDGDDSLSGAGGQDALTGGDDDDRLDGGGGRDVLLGGDDDDTLDGGAGDDTLDGGEDKDHLWGGDGADLFVLSTTRDSRTGDSDVVHDFLSGTDRIDLSAIDANTRLAGDQAFAWNGTGAGRLTVVGGMLVGDVNGDGRWDFAIDLQGAAVAGSDLVL